MLNEGTSGKRAEEEIGSSWGLQHDSRRSVCTGPEGWAGFQWVKRGEKGISGELPASGKEVEIPKAMHHFFFVCFFPLGKKPWGLFHSCESPVTWMILRAGDKHRWRLFMCCASEHHSQSSPKDAYHTIHSFPNYSLTQWAWAPTMR